MGVAPHLDRQTEATTTAKTAAPMRNARAGNGMSTASVTSNGAAAVTTAATAGPSKTVPRASGQSNAFSSTGTSTVAMTATMTTARRNITENRVAKPEGSMPGVVRGVTPATVPVTNGAANIGTNNIVSAAHAKGDLTSTTSEQNRRARRAQRAVLIFQEQCQIRQAEDAAREERACAVSKVNTSTLTSSSTCPLDGGKGSDLQPLSTMTNLAVGVAIQSSSSSTVCSAKITEVVNSIHAGPTQNATTETVPPPVHATANSMQGSTFINKISKPHIASNATTIQPALPLFPIKNQKFDSDKSSSSVPISAPTAAVTMASAKVSNGLAGSDAEDGNDDSDDDGGFVMTRTAGKRRLNVSAADMIANEILDDVNEELVVEDEDVTDPIKRLHRGYMNEAVAMVRILTTLLLFFLVPFFSLSRGTSNAATTTLTILRYDHFCVSPEHFFLRSCHSPFCRFSWTFYFPLDILFSLANSRFILSDNVTCFC